jgi:essential nuclear protein 1
MPKDRKVQNNLKQSKKIINSLKALEEEILEEENGEFEETVEEIPNFEIDKEEIENEEVSDITLDPEEEKKIQQFMFGNIGDLLVSNFKQVEPKHEIKGVSQKVSKAYKKLGTLLTDYSGGSLPKAFTIVPKLTNWQDILAIMNPSKWSNATFVAAVRIFSNSPHALQFYNLVLLPKIRNQIIEDKKLQFHVYFALKKSLWKPEAFFKGLIIPLCESGTCTTREAIIISSVIAKAHIPVLHSAAALLKLAQLPYSGTTSYFMKTIIEKKYALPTKAVDALVEHFLRFMNEDNELPSIWHQTLFSFVSIYKNEFGKSLTGKFLALITKHRNKHFYGEIKRELLAKNTVDYNMEII